MNSSTVALVSSELQDFGSHAPRSERRLRHEVSVPAFIVCQSGIAIECEIQDVSSTGMGVATQLQVPHDLRDPLATGSEAFIVFAPDSKHAPAATVNLLVKIMWRHQQCVGLRYLEVTARSRAALSTIARRAVAARNAASSRGRTLSSKDQRRIIGASRKTLDKLLPNAIWAMRTEVSRRLRLFAEGAAPHEAAKARADADLIDAHADAICRTIEVRFFRSFAKAADLEQTRELKFADVASDIYTDANEKLDVVADQIVECESTITALAHNAEERYKSILFELNIRLKDVVGRRMDTESNPLTPTAACHIFWDAVTEFCDSRRVRRQLKDAITARVIPLLGELYEALHETLDAQGVPRPYEWPVRDAAGLERDEAAA